MPNDFSTTSDAYRYFLAHNQLESPITEAIAELDINNTEQFANGSAMLKYLTILPMSKSVVDLENSQS